MFKKVTLRLIKVMWALLASVVVLLAILITALKYSLPYVDDYRSNIENYVFDKTGANVKIGQISTNWQASGPVIVLSNIELKASKQAPLDLRINNTRVEVDFWQSLLQQTFVSESFILDGIESQINSEVFYKVRPKSDGSQLLDGLSQLFLSQLNTFKVQNSLVRVRHKSGRTQNYYLETLQWLNEGNRHQASGNLFVDGFSRNSISLIIDLYGQHRSDIFGQVYLEAKQMDVSPWLDQLISQHVELSSSEANFEAWGTINSGLVDDITIEVSDTGIHWGDQKQLKLKSAQLNWWKVKDDWLLFGNDIILDANGEAFEGFNFSLRSEQGLKQLDVSRFNLASVDSLFSLFEATKNSATLSNADLNGLVDIFQVQWDGEEPPIAFAEISKFGFLPAFEQGAAYLGVENTSLDLYWQQGRGLARLTGENGRLATKDTFSKTIDYQTLNADIVFAQFDEFTSISIPTLSFVNEDVQANLSSQYLAQEQAEQPVDANLETMTQLSIYGEIKGPKQGEIHHYLPRYVLGDDTYQYLNDAIQQGRGELTQILVSGQPSHLFEKDKAKFEVRAQLKDGIFRFAKDWPALENFDAELVVDSRLMSIHGQQGQFSAMTLNNDITAQINLAAESTVVQLLITPEQMEFKQFHDLVANTPLKDVIGDVFEFVKLDGDAAATVHVSIPVSSDESGDVRGNIITNKASLDLPNIPLNFSELNALVSFENSEFTIEANQGELFGLPVTFTVNGKNVEQNYSIRADLLGDWQQSDFVEHFPSKLNDYFSGSITSSISVDVNLEQDGYQYFVIGKSDLTQTEYEITQPLVKELGEKASFSSFIMGDNLGHTLELSLDEDLFFQGRISSETGAFEQANLTIGSEKSILPGSGFDIHLELEETAFEPTLAFVTDLIQYIKQGEPSESPILSAPYKISGNIQNLSILGQEWQNVSLDAKPQTDSWLFSVGAKQTLADITVFDDIDNKGIGINASFLKIEIPTEEETQLDQVKQQLTEQGSSEAIKAQATVAKPDEPLIENSADLIRSLPLMTLRCEVCSYNDKPLGEIDIVVRPNDSNLVIEKATMNYKRNSAELSGTWVGDEGEGKTQLTGVMDSRYFGDWLLEYGLNTGIKESDAKVNLDVSWDSAPFLFGYETLSGKADFRLGEGYLSEVSDKGARIFSLFSLDSLYRKLKFDFNDIFSKGLFYNDITGSVVLNNGIAYSEDIKMDGVAGNMDMSGFTNLNNDTLDYNVAFKPKVTSSLGVLSWLAAANPVTIIGAFALDKLLEDTDVVAEVRLKVSGDLKNPEVKEVKRFTKKAQMPSKEEIEQFRQEYLNKSDESSADEATDNEATDKNGLGTQAPKTQSIKAQSPEKESETSKEKVGIDPKG